MIRMSILPDLCFWLLCAWTHKICACTDVKCGPVRMWCRKLMPQFADHTRLELLKLRRVNCGGKQTCFILRSCGWLQYGRLCSDSFCRTFPSRCHPIHSHLCSTDSVQLHVFYCLQKLWSAYKWKACNLPFPKTGMRCLRIAEIESPDIQESIIQQVRVRANSCGSTGFLFITQRMARCNLCTAQLSANSEEFEPNWALSAKSNELSASWEC